MFLAMGLLVTLILGGAFSGIQMSFSSSDKAFVNSPFVLQELTSSALYFGLFLMAPVFGQAVCKDFGSNFDEIIYSTPVNKKSFLTGRFLGAFFVLLFIFSGISLGVFMGTFFPSVQKELIGPQWFLVYLMPYSVTVIPNTFIFGSVFFLLASKTKKMAPVYVAGILAFAMASIGDDLTKDLDNRWIASLLDPFGFVAKNEVTRYWSINEQNTQLVTLTGYFLYNRLLWFAVGFGCFFTTLFTFKTDRKKAKKSFKNKDLNRERGNLKFNVVG